MRFQTRSPRIRARLASFVATLASAGALTAAGASGAHFGAAATAPALRAALPAASRARSKSSTARTHGADWCRHGGAALVGKPIVDADDRVHFVTVDGYLHVYESDGRYRFSYTVAGTPLGQPTRRESDGAVLIGTTARRIYAISPVGGLSWQIGTLSPVWSGLHPLEPGSLTYLGMDRQLYALSDRGARLYRVPVPGTPVGEPVVAPGGVVWVPLDTGLARFERAFRVTRAPFAAPVEDVVWLGQDALALSRGELTRVRGDQKLEQLGPARALASDGETAVWLTGDAPPRVRVLDAHGTRTLGAPSGASGAALVVRGHALWPGADGRVVVQALDDGALDARLEIADEEVMTPVLGDRLLAVPTRSGAVCALHLDGALAKALRGR